MKKEVKDYINSIKKELYYFDSQGKCKLLKTEDELRKCKEKIITYCTSSDGFTLDEFYIDKDLHLALFEKKFSDYRIKDAIKLDKKFIDINPSNRSFFDSKPNATITSIVIANSVIKKLPFDFRDYIDMTIVFINCIILDIPDWFHEQWIFNSILIQDLNGAVNINLNRSVVFSDIDCDEYSAIKSIVLSNNTKASLKYLLNSSNVINTHIDTKELQIDNSMISTKEVLSSMTKISNSIMESEITFYERIGEKRELKIYTSTVLKKVIVKKSGSIIALENSIFDELEFSDDKYTESIHIFNCEFNRFKAKGTIFDKLDFLNPKIKKCDRLTALKMKNISLQRNNRIEALYFHGCESEAYMEEIKESDKSKWKKLVELTPIWFNKWSNDFGRSWFCPLAWLTILGLVVFNCFNALLLNPVFEYGYSFDSSFYFSVMYDYLQFLNPAHSPDFLKEYQPSGCARIIETLFRLLSGYLYFQIVQAFRKYKIYE